MSKPVKTLIKQELAKRFDEVTSVAVCGFTGLDSASTYAMRSRLAEKGIKVTVVKNSMAKAAFKEAGLDTINALLEGPCAVAYGTDSIVSVVRELLVVNKDIPAFTIKGAVLDGDVFTGEDQIKALSKFPTREEALGQLVGCILSAGSNISAALLGPAGQIAGILKTIEEKGE
jgi:large subunit ribosomal protein L10